MHPSASQMESFIYLCSAACISHPNPQIQLTRKEQSPPPPLRGRNKEPKLWNRLAPRGLPSAAPCCHPWRRVRSRTHCIPEPSLSFYDCNPGLGSVANITEAVVSGVWGLRTQICRMEVDEGYCWMLSISSNSFGLSAP